MNINNITNKSGADKRRKRIGRGKGSGHGKTSTRGSKGAGARTGTTIMKLKEGGQTPLFKRLPKRGFSNYRFRIEYQVINVGDLEKAFEAGATVDGKALADAGLIREADGLLKVLGDGQLSKRLVVHATKVSKQAEEKIKAAGGEVKIAAVA